jgi:hypothetical protein
VGAMTIETSCVLFNLFFLILILFVSSPITHSVFCLTFIFRFISLDFF